MNKADNDEPVEEEVVLNENDQERLDRVSIVTFITFFIHSDWSKIDCTFVSHFTLSSLLFFDSHWNSLFKKVTLKKETKNVLINKCTRFN